MADCYLTWHLVHLKFIWWLVGNKLLVCSLEVGAAETIYYLLHSGIVSCHNVRGLAATMGLPFLYPVEPCVHVSGHETEVFEQKQKHLSPLPSIKSPISCNHVDIWWFKRKLSRHRECESSVTFRIFQTFLWWDNASPPPLSGIGRSQMSKPLLL